MQPLPASVDLRPLMKNGGFVTFNQGSQGSCTANCGAEDVALTEIKMGTYTKPRSRAFLYYQERVILGTTNQDSGAEMINIGEALAQWGICFDSTMQYNQNDYTTRPSAAAYAEGLQRLSYGQNPIAPTEFQDAIVACQSTPTLGGVRIGFPVWETFMDAVSNGGWVSQPGPNESILGGHAMEYVGYAMLQGPSDPAPQLYDLLLQSWGPTGDLSSGLSTFKVPHVDWNSLWVQNEGGTDNYQQVNAQAAPPPGTITLSATPTTITNDGSTTVTGQVVGTNSGDSVEVDVILPNNQVVPLFTVTASGTTVVGSGTLTATYTGPAVIQAFDHTSIPSMASNQIPVTIVAPSPTPNPCPIGNAAARSINKTLNAIPLAPTLHFPFVRLRRGRFYVYYMNPPKR